MAFRQPQQRPQAQRHPSLSQLTPAPESVKQVAATQAKRLEEESQEWILFSPVADEQESTTSRTSQTPRTANLSHLDSLETGDRSDIYPVEDNDLTCQGTEIDIHYDDQGELDSLEEGELDSLDDGLHDFHGPPPPSPRLDQSGGAVLPMHDGLGTFAPSYYPYATNDGMQYPYAPQNEGMQEHLWQFERYNPLRRRAQRRRSSVQKRLDALDHEDEMRSIDKHEERRLRIEQWRLEQSRAVLEEIERETRRRTRRLSLISGQSSAVPHQEPVLQGTPPMEDATLGKEDAETESFWERITRRVIRELMGLDETTLSVIFGEELVSDQSGPSLAQNLPPTTSTSPSTITPFSNATWEQRLLDRIARELGILANRLSEYDGAFSTYKNAGPSLPLQIPSSNKPSSLPALTVTTTTTTTQDNDAFFQPTFPKSAAVPATDTSLWGIEEEPVPNTTNATRNVAAEDKEYWERDLDVGVIFRYLRNRFSSALSSPSPTPVGPSSPTSSLSSLAERNNPPAAATGPLPPAWASTSPVATTSALGTSPESFRRADLIRQHHPLVSHAASITATRRRESILSLRRQHHLLLHRRSTVTGGSSCASQSTKRTRSGSSRRYWDFPGGLAGSGAAGGSSAIVGGGAGGGGGSAAGGSVISGTSGGYEGMMGSWGEV